MSQSQLLQDLEQYIDAKLMLWTNDSIERYIMVDVSEFAQKAILKCLLRNLCAGLVELGADDEIACRILVGYLNTARIAKQRLKTKRESNLGLD